MDLESPPGPPRRSANPALRTAGCAVCRFLICLAGVAGLWCPRAASGAPVVTPAPSASVRDYLDTLWGEAGYVATAPSRWDSTEWEKAGIGVVAVGGTALFLDRSVRNYAQGHRGDVLDRVSGHFQRFGGGDSFAVLGLFYAGGWIDHNRRARVTAEDGLSASILSGTITYVLKESIGRSRPSAHAGVYHFSPFSGAASFPSGHTTQAFAIASVIAARYRDKPWVGVLAYGSAGLVGVARIYNNAHFASDVLAGALIGTTVGRMIVHHHNDDARAHLSWAPVVSHHFTGAVFDWTY
ncbi:undecaprenyl pyrophosphate phosphatase [mine drainage metagenome]|uniref:Undecaprenyl pyrophosphate phosphatase n=1 Tax=mine drainage metagenome TaxID=410659 RepID=A0A1J5S0L9_9ZZZZ